MWQREILTDRILIYQLIPINVWKKIIGHTRAHKHKPLPQPAHNCSKFSVASKHISNSSDLALLLALKKCDCNTTPYACYQHVYKCHSCARWHGMATRAPTHIDNELVTTAALCALFGSMRSAKFLVFFPAGRRDKDDEKEPFSLINIRFSLINIRTSKGPLSSSTLLPKMNE